MDATDLYTVYDMQLQSTFVRTVPTSRAKDNTYKEFGKWVTEVFSGDPSAQQLDKIAEHDSLFKYVAVDFSAARTAVITSASPEDEQDTPNP